jgi:hypothetical protein
MVKELLSIEFIFELNYNLKAVCSIPIGLILSEIYEGIF